MSNRTQPTFGPVLSDDEELRLLAELHPDYDQVELEEARATLYRYFDLVWKIFVRLEREGSLDSLSLTPSSETPTMQEQRSSSSTI